MKYLIIVLLLISPLAFAGSVTITFTHPEPETVTGFEILWVSSTGDTGRQKLEADQMSWDHTNLDPGQAITYEAYAFNDSGYSDPTPQVTANIQPKSEAPNNNITIPVYVAPQIPGSPSISGKCSVEFECTFN